MLPLILAVLLGLAALAVVLAPLFVSNVASASGDGATTTTLAERERAAKAALQDVEFDYQLGNLAEDDYRGLRERYMRRALAALKGRYDREKALDDAIEAQVRALRARDAAISGNGDRAATSVSGPSKVARRAASEGHSPRPNRSNKRGGSGKNGRRST